MTPLLTLPGDFLDTPEPRAEDFLISLRSTFYDFDPQPQYITIAPPLTTKSPHLNSVDFVFIRRDGNVPPLFPQYDRPYLVKVVSIDRHQPMKSSGNVTPAQPRPSGRPKPSSRHIATTTPPWTTSPYPSHSFCNTISTSSPRTASISSDRHIRSTTLPNAVVCCFNTIIRLLRLL